MPGSSVHFSASKNIEWAAVSLLQGSSQGRDRNLPLKCGVAFFTVCVCLGILNKWKAEDSIKKQLSVHILTVYCANKAVALLFCHLLL